MTAINSFAKMRFIEQLDAWIEDRTFFYETTGDEGTLKLIESLRKTKEVLEEMDEEV